MKRCTYCGKEYPDEAMTCAIDGQPLAKFPPELEPPNDNAPDEEEFATIEIFPNREAAELAATKLEAYGISCWLKSDDAGGMYPNLALAGGVRLQVLAADADAAVALLKAQLSASEMSELEVKAAGAPPLEDSATVKFAPVQILLGLGLGILLCLLCQQIEKSGTSIYNDYTRNGTIYRQWTYENGHLTELKRDRNLDGKWDEWVHYRDGQATSAEYDNNFDGKPDEWWTFSRHGTDTLRKDTDFNGVPDEFCTYKDKLAQQLDIKPNGSKYAVTREIFQNGVVTEIWRGGDSNGVFKEIVKYDPFFNATNTRFGEFPSK